MEAQSSKSLGWKKLEEKWVPVLQDSPSTEEFQQAYDEEYTLFMEEGIVSLDEGKLDKLHEVIIDRIGTGKSVLEVGFGDGVMSFTLARRGNTVVGVDISKVVLERARARLSREPGLSLRFEFGDARTLDFKDGSFDYVISRNLVEHLLAADARQHMQEVWRVLRNQGCYLCFVPSRVYKGYCSAGFHLHMYSLREMIELVSSCGFRVRWIEPKFKRLGVKEVPSAILLPFLWYERGLELIKKIFPSLALEIGGRRIIPTVMVAAYKIR